MPRPSRHITDLVDWDATKTDPVAFAGHLLHDPAGNPVIPHPAQETILRGTARHTTRLTGRQFGKTTVIAVDAAWFGTTRPHRTVMVVATSRALILVSAPLRCGVWTIHLLMPATHRGYQRPSRPASRRAGRLT